MIDVAVPGKASTIIIVRPAADDAFEVLMTRRSPRMKVLGGFLVFPGGCLEQEDWSDEMLDRCRGLTPFQAQQILATNMAPEQSLGHWVAAVRELFEEVGVHFFVNESETHVTALDRCVEDRLMEKREALSQGRLTLAELLGSEQLCCDLSRLNYLFHRITPDHHPMRFDTRFYVAALPQGQTALACSEEVSETLWLTPADGIKQSESGRLPMMPPTLIALRTLAQQVSWRNLNNTYQLRS